MNILYLVKHFPCRSQTFVVNEVAALTSRGCDVHVVSAIDLNEPVEIDPVIRSRVVYLQHGYLYRYGQASDTRSDARLVGKVAAALDADGPVPVDWRRRLWTVLGDLEPNAGARARGFLDALSVLSLTRTAAIDHLHCDFAEDNVKLAYVVSQVTGLPFTFKMRAYDIFAEPLPDLAKWAAAAARVFTISEYNREYICRQWGIAPENVVVIYDGVSLEQVTPIADYVHHPFRIISVSRLVEKKGFPILLDACRMLKDRLPFQCDIFGDGPMMESLQAQINQSGLAGVVTLHGGRSHAEVLAALESASVFVLACVQAGNGDRDGTPNSLLEAMARGIPVVSTRLSGIPEIVEDGADGLLVPPGDAGLLADAIARLAGDGEFAETIRQNAQQKVTTRFTIDRTVDEFLRSLNANGDAHMARPPVAQAEIG